MRTLLVLLLASAAVVFVSCSTNEPDLADSLHVSSEEAIIPLAQGNTWLYQISVYSDGEFVRDYWDSIQVDKIQTIDSVIWYRYNDPMEGPFWLRNISGGTAVLSGDSVSVLYPYPAVRGDSIVAFTDSGYVGVRVDSVGQIVVTSAGAFSCYHYELVNTQENELITEYYRYRLGLVRRSASRTYIINDTTKRVESVTMELKGYSVHK